MACLTEAVGAPVELEALEQRADGCPQGDSGVVGRPVRQLAELDAFSERPFFPPCAPASSMRYVPAAPDILPHNRGRRPAASSRYLP